MSGVASHLSPAYHSLHEVKSTQMNTNLFQLSKSIYFKICSANKLLFLSDQ